jgi:hypothetical protein
MTETYLQKLLAKTGLPSRDLHELPSSNQVFPDGAHYRIEISGVERANTFQVMVQEAERRKVVVHRVIAVVGGSTLLDRGELRAMAQIARDAHIEVILTPNQSRGWDTGRQLVTPEGLVSGLRLRGADNLGYALGDILRGLEAGFRGFLVVDEGLLWVLTSLKKTGDIPPETVLKVSVFAGHANPAGARVLETLGATTFNPLSDLSLPMLAAIRQAVRIPMDVYVSLVDAMGGFCRFWEAAEIARVASPCYFKFEPGASEGSLYKPWVSESFHADFAREKIRHAEIVQELVGRLNPSLRTSLAGVPDLVLPRP